MEWRACEGPPPKTDCEGEWIIQRPDAESDKEWSVCKLKDGQKYGRTWRQKEYQITTPQGELTRDGVTIPWGKPCMADVVIDGVMNTLEMKPKEKGGQLVFAELCSKAQSVEECDKSQWELDRRRGQNCDRYGENCDGCALDDDDEPVKRYTRTVEGACAAEDGTPYAEYDDDGTGNATEDFVGCCYKSEWMDVGLAVNGEQPQTRVVKNCTGGEDDGDPDGIATTRNKAVCYVPEWTDDHKDGECGDHFWGQQKYARNVKSIIVWAEGRAADSEVRTVAPSRGEQGATCQDDVIMKRRGGVTACEARTPTQQGKAPNVNKRRRWNRTAWCIGNNGWQTAAYEQNCDSPKVRSWSNVGTIRRSMRCMAKQGTCEPGQLKIDVKREVVAPSCRTMINPRLSSQACIVTGQVATIMELVLTLNRKW